MECCRYETPCNCRHHRRRRRRRRSLACLGPGIRAYLSFAKGGVGSAPATIINGVAALGCGAQYRRLLAVRRTSIVPPCQSFLLPPPIHPSSLLFSFSFFALPPSTIFADIDEPPCALLSSTWTLPDETRLDVFAREIDRLGNRFSRVSGLFIPSFLPRPFLRIDDQFRRKS